MSGAPEIVIPMTLVKNGIPWAIAWAGFAPKQIDKVLQFAIFIFCREYDGAIYWDREERTFKERKYE